MQSSQQPSYAIELLRLGLERTSVVATSQPLPPLRPSPALPKPSPVAPKASLPLLPPQSKEQAAFLHLSLLKASPLAPSLRGPQRESKSPLLLFLSPKALLLLLLRPSLLKPSPLAPNLRPRLPLLPPCPWSKPNPRRRARLRLRSAQFPRLSGEA